MGLMLALLLQDDVIRGLQSDDYAAREAATAKLLERGPGPELDRALAHRDPEVRARAEWVRRALAPEPAPTQVTIDLGGLSVWSVDGIVMDGTFIIGEEIVEYGTVIIENDE